MANPWFRMYAEFAFDPKVQIVTEALQRRYVMLLCLQCNEYLQNATDSHIALALRITPEEWLSTKESLIQAGLLLDDMTICGWEKRQYISDLKDPTAAERQKRYRKSKRNDRNATVTSRLPESDTDTESDTDKTIKPSRINALDDGFHEFWNAYPKKVGKTDAIKAWKKAKPPIDQILIALVWQKNSLPWTKENGQFIPNPATYINQGRWMDEKPTDDFVDWVHKKPRGLVL